MKEKPIIDANDINDVRIDVYYRNGEDFKRHNAPKEVIVTFPEYYGVKPVVFSNSLFTCYNVKDTTEEQLINKKIPYNEHKIRTASIEVYGVVNYHVSNCSEDK